MSPYLIILLFVSGVLVSAICSTLTFALRDFSRARLATALEGRGREQWVQATLQHAGELAFVTAWVRLVANIAIFVAIIEFLRGGSLEVWTQYLIGTSVAVVITLVWSVIVPHALAKHAGEELIAWTVRPLHGLRVVSHPLLKLLHVTESVVKRATTTSGAGQMRAEEDLQSEILAAVEEGEKTGVVDVADREMIESVIHFRETSAGHVMTARPDIVGLECHSSLQQARELVEQTGHSRIPVYEGSLDHIVGMLYARDLLKYVGGPTQSFELRANLRPAYFVPETRLLRDLLADFRLQKVHIAVVLDEYGGTAGLVTIEDVLEEIVGDISDEHEPAERPVIDKIDNQTADVDARIHIDELNDAMGTELDEEAGYDTLGGFVSTHLGRIPEPGASFEHAGVTYTVVEAEPHKVGRVRVALPTRAETATEEV